MTNTVRGHVKTSIFTRASTIRVFTIRVTDFTRLVDVCVYMHIKIPHKILSVPTKNCLLTLYVFKHRNNLGQLHENHMSTAIDFQHSIGVSKPSVHITCQIQETMR